MSTVALGSIIPQLSFLDAIIQDNTLARLFHDTLYPELQFRSEAMHEKWEAQVGDQQVFTKPSLLTVDTEPLEPGVDPQPENEAFEQWRVKAAQYGKASDVNMPSSRTALDSLFMRKLKSLGLNAGQTMNRLPRNRLYCAYTGGHTVAETGGAPTTSFEVASISGFTEQLQSGQLQTVSAANPKSFLINGVAATSQVIAAQPIDGNFPQGRGTITLSGAGDTIVAGDAIVAADAASIIRSGGGLSVDALASTDTLTLADIRMTVAGLRRNRVPPHSDGYYHCHLDPIAEAQLFADQEFQNANESRWDGAEYQNFAVGKVQGCVFYTNSECPGVINTGAQQVSRPVSGGQARLGKEIYAETVNDGGVQVLRTIVTGGGAIYEKYIDEAEYLSEAGTNGIQQVGGFSIVNNGIQIPTERIRLIIRAPQDRLQQQVSLAWSWSGDFGIPSDFFGGLGGSRFKRGGVIESGSTL